MSTDLPLSARRFDPAPVTHREWEMLGRIALDMALLDLHEDTAAGSDLTDALILRARALLQHKLSTLAFRIVCERLKHGSGGHDGWGTPLPAVVDEAWPSCRGCGVPFVAGDSGSWAEQDLCADCEVPAP